MTLLKIADTVLLHPVCLKGENDGAIDDTGGVRG